MASQRDRLAAGFQRVADEFQAAYANSRIKFDTDGVPYIDQDGVGLGGPVGSSLPTKRVMHALGAPNTVYQPGAGLALANWSERKIVLLPVTTTRWRLRVANWNLLTNANLTSPTTISDIYLGDPANASTTTRVGPGLQAAPTKVIDVATSPAGNGVIPTNGTEWVSQWVDTPAHQFTRDIGKTLCYGLSGAAGGDGRAMTSSRYGWGSTTAGDLTIAGPGGYVASQALMDVRIEYEFVGNNSIGLYLGASNDEGYNSRTGFNGITLSEAEGAAATYLAAHEAWPGQYGLRRRVPWVNAAISGATEAPFDNTTDKAYVRLNFAEITKPDYAVINSVGNSIMNGGTAAGALTALNSILGCLYTFGIRKWFACTVQPAALASGDAKEVQRQSFNTTIRNMNGGIQGLLDIDLIMQDPANLLWPRAPHRTQDGSHYTRNGHSYLANFANLGGGD